MFGSKHNAPDAKTAFLRTLPVVGAQPGPDLLTLSTLFDEVDVDPGYVLVREGETSRQLYLVIDGRAVVSAGGTIIGTIGPGEFVGEVSLLDRAPHMATVTAATPMQVLAAARSGYGTLFNNPAVLRSMAQTMARRLRQSLVTDR